MTIKFKVPSVVCSGCAETITKEIQKNQPEAKINVNIETKILTVETTASEEAIKEMIKSVGHQVE